MNLKVKILTKRFGKEYEYSVDMSEAHKAWYLFFNPQARGVFNDGTLGLRGEDIVGIEIDPVNTMGWNPAHRMDADDWNEIKDSGVDRQLREKLRAGKEVAQLCSPQELNTPLETLIEQKYPQLASGERRNDGIKSIGEVLRR